MRQLDLHFIWFAVKWVALGCLSEMVHIQPDKVLIRALIWCRVYKLLLDAR